MKRLIILIAILPFAFISNAQDFEVGTSASIISAKGFRSIGPGIQINYRDWGTLKWRISSELSFNMSQTKKDIYCEESFVEQIKESKNFWMLGFSAQPIIPIYKNFSCTPSIGVKFPFSFGENFLLEYGGGFEYTFKKEKKVWYQKRPRKIEDKKISINISKIKGSEILKDSWQLKITLKKVFN